jgi:hypothetical protein
MKELGGRVTLVVRGSKSAPNGEQGDVARFGKPLR